MAIITLNPQQEIIKNEAVHWFLHESTQVFEIDGPAGTGKSVLIGQILKELGLKPYEVAAMAYTGQASIVMRMRGFPTARSIHSTLYELVEIEDEDTRLAETFGVSAKKKVFALRKDIDPSIRLFFIDEGYMVPREMVNDILSFGIKVIVAGDAHQLPPVGGEPGFLTGYGVHHLTQLMRQSESNPIVYIANRAMNGEPIHNGSYSSKGYGNQNVLVINDDEFIPDMIGFADCLLCGTNKTREILNSQVRKLAGFEGVYPHHGERLVCRKNDWERSLDGIALANGLAGTVINNPDISRDGKIFTINFKPDMVNGVFFGVPVNYDYFISDFEKKNAIKSSFSKWTVGELFDYAYALTTHLAQGSEYGNCVYIEEFMRQQIQNQLNYTAATRAVQTLIWVKKKHKIFNIPFPANII